jgi:hypothetical protein
MRLLRSVRYRQTLPVTDVTLDLLFVETNGRDGVPTRPEVFTSEVPLFALHPGNRNRAFAFNEPNR